MAQVNTSDSVRISHACLISAETREEALFTAERMAMEAVCSGTRRKPCGICRDCRKVAEHIHPDVITVGRLTDEKGRRKQIISVEQIREMSSDAYVLPNEAACKVYIIDEAEKMNVQAQNAALKLLEEPPAGVIFLLCTDNAMQLLPTVRSRCAHYTAAVQSGDVAWDKNELAGGYLKAVSGGDPAQLFRWCTAHEETDSRTAAEFFEAVKLILTDMLCSRIKRGKLSREDMMRLCILMDKCSDMLRVNTGVKHIFGLLAVDSIAGSGNRGTAN